jgi:protein-tyrosine phosphatase
VSEFSVLVVCLGNVCRSPLAERVLRLRLAELPDGPAGAVGVSSAGIRALVGAPMDETAAAELRRLGGDPAGSVSRQLQRAMVEEADLVLTATRQLRSRLLEDEPRALKRTFTIREFAALAAPEVLGGLRPATLTELVSRAATSRSAVAVDGYDVPDPIGRSPEFHREVADLIDEACTGIAAALAAAGGDDPAG